MSQSVVVVVVVVVVTSEGDTVYSVRGRVRGTGGRRGRQREREGGRVGKA